MTQFYIGVKIVEAWPQDEPMPNDPVFRQRVSCNELDWNPRPGYAVKYEDGYISWSLKEVFEKYYLPMGQDPSKVSEEMVSGFIEEIGRTTLPDEKTTFVQVNTKTGFTQYDTSSCVDPSNYDEEIGVEICTKRITDKLWSYLGFCVQWARFGLSGNNKR